MEENKDIKISLSTFFLIFAIIIIVVMSYFLYRFYNEKIDATEESEKLSQQINQLEKKVNDLNQDSKNETTPNNKMSIELAYGILNKYKTEKLPDAKWYITDVSLVAHGDNNTYLVAYKEENLDGYDEEVSTIIEYKNNKWTTDLPGSSGFSDEEMDKYNFVDYKENENVEETNKEMSLELAYGILNKYKAEKLPDAKWYITDVSLVAHGDNNTYLVAYKEENLDGYDEEVSTIVEYKNNKWTTDLPGSSGFSDEEMDKYNFVYYD